MDTLDDSNTKALTLTYDKRNNEISERDQNLRNLQPNIVIPSSLKLYQWNDFDLRWIRLFMDQLAKEQSDTSLENISIPSVVQDLNESFSTTSVPVMALNIDFLILIFIRYLQLIHLLPWSTPTAICDRPVETLKRSQTELSPTAIPKIKKQKKMRELQSSKFGLCGLTNIGNTCFMNSALQCLSNIPKLTKWAKEEEFPKYEDTVTQAYTSLIKSMWSGKNSTIAPYDVKKRVSRHAPIFADYAQKDSHEFMNSLLNAMHYELLGNHFSEHQSSIVTDLFCIQTTSKVTCLDCNASDSVEEVTYCLPLPLGAESRVNLDTLVDEFLKEEKMDGEYFCSNCQDLRSAKQKTSLCKPLPPVIIVQLKRFTFDETDDKLDTFVEYPIENWNVNSSDDACYDLAAVSMHVGNLRGGHYTTLARLNGSDQWYHFNDSRVENITDTECIVNRNAYVLVYLKRD